MRNIKELLEIVLFKSKEEKDTFTGLCRYTNHLSDIKVITIKEGSYIDNFLKQHIINNDYSHYQVIYCECDYGQQNSLFFFKINDWEIRIKWLEEVISKL